jgi:hypothetical protein
MSASNVVAIAIALAVIAFILLMAALAKEISRQKRTRYSGRRSAGTSLGLSPEWSAYLQWWLSYLLMVTIVALGVWWLCRLFGLQSAPYFWFYWPMAGSGAYYAHEQGKKEGRQDNGPRQHQGGSSFDELVGLCNGDRALARRLIDAAGSADRAIAQLLRDRR